MRQLTPVKTTKAVKLLASGVPQTEIAQAVGVTQQAVSKLKKRKADLIAEEAARYQASLPDIVSTNLQLIKTGKVLSDHAANPYSEENPGGTKNPTIFRDPKDIIKALDLTSKINANLLKAVGILTTPAQSQIFMQINGADSSSLAPEILALLDKANDDNDVIDVELGL